MMANAEMVIQQFRPLSGIEFGYNRQSVEWLEGHIERLRQTGKLQDEATREELVNVLGSFLGECIVRRYGGAWTQREGIWCVAFDSHNVAFPFAKVAKQMENGREGGDGIGGFFSIIPEVFRKCLGLPPPT
ncbi:MAG: hypothetical protein ACLQVG_18735 [Terriglobia bacterium]